MSAAVNHSSGPYWQSGKVYEGYVGRWSRRVAPIFLDWLPVPAGRNWLDLGCGTGALTQAILTHRNPARVVGIDRSPEFIAHSRDTINDRRATFREGDARQIPLPEESQDALVSALVLNFIPAEDQARAVSGMRHVLRPRGTFGAYVWDYSLGMAMMRIFWDAAAALDPDAAQRDESPRFPICQPEPLAALVEGAGFRDVATRAIEIPTIFHDVEDYWQPFLAGGAPAPAYVQSLDEEHREALRAEIRSRLPIAADGTISLTARAWAVRGTR